MPQSFFFFPNSINFTRGTDICQLIKLISHITGPALCSSQDKLRRNLKSHTCVWGHVPAGRPTECNFFNATRGPLHLVGPLMTKRIRKASPPPLPVSKELQRKMLLSIGAILFRTHLVPSDSNVAPFLLFHLG